ncbi:uncharacterized protein ACB057_009431 [Neosynchiropus ocellatus]
MDLRRSINETMIQLFLAFHAVITVLGNLLVIVSIVYFKQLHSPTNYLILSLAVADLLVGIIVYPLTLHFSQTSCFFRDELLCSVRSVMDVSLCTSSILNLCCISFDRYYSVCQPLMYRAKMTDHVVVVMIAVNWVASFLVGVFVTTVGFGSHCEGLCVISVFARLLGLVIAFYLPMTVMLCIYLKIFMVAHKQVRSIQITIVKTSNSVVSRMERKATKTLAIVMGTFLFCWLPFFLSTTILEITPVSLPLPLIDFLSWFALSNSTLNPFIYGFFYSWFRSAFRMIIAGKLLKGDFRNSKLSSSSSPEHPAADTLPVLEDHMETFNSTGTHHCSGFGDSHLQAFLCFLFYFVLSSFSLVTICGNLLVVVSVAYFRQLHTPTNFLVLSLAACDLLVGAVVFPLSMKSPESSCHRLYDSLCKVRGVFDVALCSCSILNLSCISIDRYYAVCHPLTYKSKISSRVAGWMILLIWSVSAMIGVSFLFGGSHHVCDEPCLGNLIQNIAGLLFAFYLPVLTILLIYLRIFLVARKQARSIQKFTANRTERRATRTLAIVMGVFLVCWLPFFLCTTVRSFTSILLPISFNETLNWLALSNSMLNPFIYAFFYSWFRAAFKIIISGKLIRGDFKNSMLQ